MRLYGEVIKQVCHRSGYFLITRNYVRGMDVDKANLFLARYHKRTVNKFKDPVAVPAKAAAADKEVTTQFKVFPKFLHDARSYKKHYYFCYREDDGCTNLIKYNLLTRERVNLAQLESNASCKVTDVSVAGDKLAVFVKSDQFNCIYIIHESTGTLIRALPSAHQLHWVSDTRLFYTTISDKLRPDTVFYWHLDNPQPEMVYKSVKTDEVVSIACTKDKLYTTVNVNTKLASEIHLLDNNSDSKVCTTDNRICSRDQGYKCYVEHRQGTLLALVSSEENPNLKLHYCHIDQTKQGYNIADFKEYPVTTGVIHEMEVFDAGIVLYTSHDMKHKLLLLPDNIKHDNDVMTHANTSEIDFPEDVSVVEPNNNSAASATHLSVKTYSYTKPPRSLAISFSKFSVSKGRLYTRGRYDYMKLQVASVGGVDVPITVIGSEAALQSTTPTLFIVYGCYGECLNYSYDTLPHDLLEKNWKVVLCHVRGGGELGTGWYKGGIGANKQTTILDTLNCIKFVQSFNLASPRTSVLLSYSAGSVIGAAAAQSAAGLVNKLVLRMPFLDLQTALRDQTLVLTAEEQEEWGSQVADICPCTNDNPVNYNVLLTVGAADARAPSWHAANFISHIQRSISRNKIFVNLLENADHSGFDESALRIETQFILDESIARQPFWQTFRYVYVVVLLHLVLVKLYIYYKFISNVIPEG